MGLGVGQVVLVVSLWVVGGHVGAQFQAGLDERVHGSHAACGFPPLLPAHLTTAHLARQSPALTCSGWSQPIIEQTLKIYDQFLATYLNILHQFKQTIDTYRYVGSNKMTASTPMQFIL